MFNGHGKSYYYVTDDESIQVGDFVYVSSGKDNHESLVEVVDVEYFSRKVTLPKAPASVNADIMTDDELYTKLLQGIKDADTGKTQNAEEAFRKFREANF